MRVLIGSGEDLAELYAVPRTPWLRVNFVATVDGAATGEDGRSGSINNEIDHQVFGLLRAQADVVVIGAGTARIEGYADIGKPLVLVSRAGVVPEHLRDAPAGDDAVIIVGEHRVDLVALKRELAARGWGNQVCEGGPHLLRDLLDEGAADELDTTVVPRAVGGHHPRITDGAPLDVPLSLHTLLEHDGTLLARWLVQSR